MLGFVLRPLLSVKGGIVDGPAVSAPVGAFEGFG